MFQFSPASSFIFLLFFYFFFATPRIFTYPYSLIQIITYQHTMKTDSKSQQIPQLQSLFFFLDIIPFSYFSTSFTFHHSIFVRFLEIIHSSFSFHSLPSVRKKFATQKSWKKPTKEIKRQIVKSLINPFLYFCNLLFLYFFYLFFSQQNLFFCLFLVL